MSRKRKSYRELLSELRITANFENASFGKLWGDVGDPLPKTEEEVTDFIRRRTKLYRETWVIPLIDELERRLRVSAATGQGAA
ncbi:hypothetical protein [Azospirillum argentinense]|uniref:hypothetical protein n=1 Tax=Azospirillum argentinense TaxID=2970906 RepID=UPI0032E01FF4